MPSINEPVLFSDKLNNQPFCSNCSEFHETPGILFSIRWSEAAWRQHGKGELFLVTTCINMLDSNSQKAKEFPVGSGKVKISLHW